MSRHPSAKYKISAPQPITRDIANLRAAYSTDNGPYPSFQPAPPPAPADSPARPARSRMRDGQPPPNRSLLPPVQTRRPSNDAHDASPASPISPSSPSSHGHAQHPSLSSDVFAADRSQRMELRAQVNAAAQQASQPFQAGDGPGSEQMRNIVGAFRNAGKQRDDARRPGKSEARVRKPQKESDWEEESPGGEFGEIEMALRKVRKDWPFVMESDFSSSTLALSLLAQSPSTTLPAHPGLSSFLRLNESLSAGLQAAVQAHSETFAASLPAHQKFLDILEKAQKQVQKSKAELGEARNGFAGKGRTELAGIRARERTVRDMLKILDTIDHLKQIPDQLESLIGDKSFLQASLMLVHSLKIINKPELKEIGALSDLRAYFVSQETTFTDILVEELHNHIYLKTFYSDSRWKPYTPGQVDLPTIDPQDGDPYLRSPDPSASTPPGIHSNGNGNTAAGPGPSSRFSRYLNHLNSRPSTTPVLVSDDDLVPPPTPSVPPISQQRSTSGSAGMAQAGSHGSLSSLAGTAPAGSFGGGNEGNPEADSYMYIETLLEAMAAMGRLGQALDMVAQRVPAEIHALIEGTLDEIEERSEQRRDEADFSIRPQSLLTSESANETFPRPKSLFKRPDTVQIELSLGTAGPPQHAALLNDLFWTLYSKLAAVLEGHRVMYQVSRWISSRKDFRDSTTRGNSSLSIPVLEMWKPVQQEVRTLLSNYLTDDSQGATLDRHPIMSINEILQDPKVSRDRSKPIFKFSDGDTRAIQKEIKPVDDSVQQALRSSVPGLVSLQTDQPIVFTEDDRFSSGKYRILVTPNAFNVTTLFQPTISFINRATAIVPPGFEEETTGFSTIVEDFVVNVFLPQLDENVTAGFQQAVSGYDAYQVDRSLLTEMEQPPLKSSVRVMSLIHSLCVMLQTTPFHRENYSRLIVGVIVQYYQQCSARFKELASLPATLDTASDRPLALPAVWAQREDMIKCLSAMRAVHTLDRDGVAAASQKEVKLETDLLGNQPVVESSLINSQRKLEALGNLSQSLRWFIDCLLDLQAVADEPTSMNDDQLDSDMLKAAPSLSTDSDEPRLPLTHAMAQRYHAIIQTYEQLAEMVLNTIRLEVRCRVICNLGASLQKGDFRLESEALEPDSDVLDLNVNLVEAEEVAGRTISPDDHSFIFRALGHLVDHCFVSAASKHMKIANAAGVRKIKRNILSLQQTLRGIAAASEEGILARSVAYWDLYAKGPRETLEDLKKMEGSPPFSFEEYNTMLKLQCGDETDELNTYLIDLHGLSMTVEGWEIGGD